jgi:signal transduction histidine kinase
MVIEVVSMAQSGSSPEGRTSAVPVWLYFLLVLLLGTVVAGLVPGGARVAVVGCCVVAIAAAGCFVWEEMRRQRVISELKEKRAIEGEALRGRLGGQERAIVRLAKELLPTVVERLQQGALAEEALSGLTLHPGLSPELGAAYDAVLRSVIDAVEAQEDLRDSAQRAFVNIARRVQAIVHQQAQDLREIEDKYGDNPDFFNELLHLDHGTALVGRLADSLAVLGGARPGRQWRQSVPLFNVLRGAMSRIIDYERVDLHSVAEFAVVGPAVEPLIHALAELLDNATRYSPPRARVHLTASEVQSGVAVEIEDAGVGLTEEARIRAEGALGQTKGFDLDDLGETPRLGLAVVGRLSRANNFTVALRPSAYGGVRAVLTVPGDLLTVTPGSGGQIARAASLPPLRPKDRQPSGPSKVMEKELSAQFKRNANGLPQRRHRRGAPVPTDAQLTGTVPSSASKDAVQPGIWLSAFQDGVSGKLSTGDTEPTNSDASLDKDK